MFQKGPLYYHRDSGPVNMSYRTASSAVAAAQPLECYRSAFACLYISSGNRDWTCNLAGREGFGHLVSFADASSSVKQVRKALFLSLSTRGLLRRAACCSRRCRIHSMHTSWTTQWLKSRAQLATPKGRSPRSWQD